jgi:hypothetical protein
LKTNKFLLHGGRNIFYNSLGRTPNVPKPMTQQYKFKIKANDRGRNRKNEKTV